MSPCMQYAISQKWNKSPITLQVGLIRRYTKIFGRNNKDNWLQFLQEEFNLYSPEQPAHLSRKPAEQKITLSEEELFLAEMEHTFQHVRQRDNSAIHHVKNARQG